MSPTALDGLRVLDLTRLLPGPYATLILADLGADVVKVEEPGRGDYARGYEPRLGGEGAAFQLLNRNKRSLTVNLKAAEGREILLKLARGADVLVESFRPGVMERLGLGYDALARENARLIYASITGYGQRGPYAQRVGHDLNYVSVSGALSLSGVRDGHPLPMPVQVADLAGGALPAVIGILAALQARDRVGHGQHVDVGMAEGMTALLANAVGEMSAFGTAPRRGEGRLTGGRPCYGVYRTRDGKFVALAALEPKFWNRFCELVGRPDLQPLAAPRDPARREEAERALAGLFAARTREEWAALLADDDVCLTPVLDLDEALEDPHYRARGGVERRALRDGTTVPYPRVTPLLSATPAAFRTPPPALGEHTDGILATLGYDEATLAQLRAKQII